MVDDRPRRVRRAPVIVAIAALVVLADQASKTWALNSLEAGPRHVIGPLQFKLSFNSGAAFGLGKGFGPFLLAAGVGVVLYLVRYSRHLTGLLPNVALALVLAGATGNLVDRLIRGHGGAVVDFIDLGWWPTFNVADSAIVCGAVLLVLVSGRE